MNLPEGFTLEEPPTKAINLPPGFFLEGEEPQEVAPPKQEEPGLGEIALRGLESAGKGALSLFDTWRFNRSRERQEFAETARSWMTPEQQAASADSMEARKEQEVQGQIELLNSMQKYKKDMAALGKDIPEFTDLPKDPKFLEWAAFNAPNALVWIGPFMAASVVPGGGLKLGYEIGRADLQSDRIAKVMERYEGVVTPKTVEEINQELKETDSIVSALAIPYAATELLGPAGAIVRGKYGKEAIKAMSKDLLDSSYMKIIAKEAGKNTVEEFFNEASQEMIIDVLKKLRDNTDFFTINNVQNWINAGAAGAVGAGVPGAAGGTYQKYQATKEAVKKEIDPRTLILEKINAAKEETRQKQAAEKQLQKEERKKQKAAKARRKQLELPFEEEVVQKPTEEVVPPTVEVTEEKPTIEEKPAVVEEDTTQPDAGNYFNSYEVAHRDDTNSLQKNVVPGIPVLTMNSLVLFNDDYGNLQAGIVQKSQSVRNEDGSSYMAPLVTTSGDPFNPKLLKKEQIVESFVLPFKTGRAGHRTYTVPIVPKVLKLIEAYKNDLISKDTFNRVSDNLVYHIQVTSTNNDQSPRIPSFLINASTNKIDPKDLMEWLTTADEMQAMRPDLVVLAKMIAPFMDTLPIKAYPNKKHDEKTKNPAQYWRVSHEIELFSDGMEASAALHEMVHAVSVRILNKYFEWTLNTTKVRGPLNELPPHIRTLWDLFNTLRNDTIALKRKGRMLYMNNSGAHYGLTNIAEFVSEGLMNRTFQLDMLKRPAKPSARTKKGLWNTFISAVGRMLGFSSNSTETLFSQFVEAAADTLSQQKDEWSTLPEELGTIDQYNYRQFYSALDTILDGDIGAAEGMAEVAPTIKDDADIKAATLSKEIDWIPQDPDKETIIKEALEDTDGPDLQNFYAGALQASEIRRSSLIKNIYRLMDNARKRAARWERTYVQPVEKLFGKILRKRKDTLLMLDIFKSELLSKETFTIPEIMDITGSAELTEGYMALRKALHEAMMKQNEALLDMGFKPVTALDAYFAARWSGPFTSVIRDQEGKIVWVVRENTRKKAEQAVEWVKTKFDSLVAEDVHYNMTRFDENMLVAGYKEMIKMLDKDDPYTQELQKAWERAITGGTENLLNQEKHFKRKTGVQGYRGARPYADSFEDARDFFIEQFKYLKGANHWAEMQRPLKTAKEVLLDPSIQNTNKYNAKYAKEYIKIVMGYGTEQSIDRAEKVLADWVGKDVVLFEQAVGMAKALFYITKLGYNIGYTVYALLQPTLGAGRHALLTSKGHNHNIGVTITKSIYDGMAFSMYHWLNNFGRWRNWEREPKFMKMAEAVRNAMTKEGQLAADYMEQNGIVDINPMTDIQDLKLPESIHMLRAIGGWTITGSEQISRSMAFFGFVHHLAQSRKLLPLDEMFMMAEDGTKDTMVDYRPGERAMVFTKLGTVGKGLATLQTFKFNWMSQLWKYSKMALKDGNARPFVMQMGAYLILSGMLGLVGIDDLEDIWLYILTQLPDEQYAALKHKSIKRYMLENMPLWMNYGGVSYLTGTNINTRGSLGDIIPFSPFDDTDKNIGRMFPFVGDTMNTAGAVIAGAKQLMGLGSPEENKVAMYRGLPTFAKGPMEEVMGFMGSDKIATSTSDPTLGVYKRDEKDIRARRLGLRTIKEAEASEGRYRQDKIMKMTNERKSRAAKRFHSAVLSGNPNATNYLNDYITLGGDPKNLVSSGRITEVMKRRYLSYADQLRVKAKPGNRAAILDLIDYLNNYQPINR